METRIDTARLHAIAARLKLWLLGALLWLSQWMGAALPRDLRLMMRNEIRDTLALARMIIMILAIARWVETTPRVPGQRAAARPHGAARGLRRTDPCANDLRNLRRIVRLRGRTIAAQLAALRDMLDNIDVWTARVCARLDTALRGARLVMLHPSIVARRAPSPAGTWTDDSS